MSEQQNDLRERTTNYALRIVPYWLELLVKSDIVTANKLEALRKETDEIIAILVTIVTKVKKRIGR